MKMVGADAMASYGGQWCGGGSSDLPIQGLKNKSKKGVKE